MTIYQLHKLLAEAHFNSGELHAIALNPADYLALIVDHYEAKRFITEPPTFHGALLVLSAAVPEGTAAVTTKRTTYSVVNLGG